MGLVSMRGRKQHVVQGWGGGGQVGTRARALDFVLGARRSLCKIANQGLSEPVQYGLEDYFAAVGRLGGSGDQEAVAKVETMLLSPWRSLYLWGQLSALCGIGLLSSLKFRTGIVACDALLLSPPFCFPMSPHLTPSSPALQPGSQLPRVELRFDSELSDSPGKEGSYQFCASNFSSSTGELGGIGRFPKGGHAFSVSHGGPKLSPQQYAQESHSRLQGSAF